MSNISRYSQLFVMIFAVAITAIIIGLSRLYSSSDRQDSLQQGSLKAWQKKAESNLAAEEKGEEKEKAESSPISQAKAVSTDTATYKTTSAFEQYKPKYMQVAIHPNNYGDRYTVDVNGNSLNNLPIVVLHETVNSARSAINTFRTPHVNDSNQVSYHALITLDGTILYFVPADKRAFGAGNSVFKSSEGIETVQTNPNLAASVNNFAYHISLETPPDGRKSNQSAHSGYTDSQYKSLAWLLALSNIPEDRITTHKNVDLSGGKFDPRSFNFDKFFAVLRSYRQKAVDKTPVKQ